MQFHKENWTNSIINFFLFVNIFEKINCNIVPVLVKSPNLRAFIFKTLVIKVLNLLYYGLVSLYILIFKRKNYFHALSSSYKHKFYILNGN